MEKVKVVKVYDGETHIATIEAYGDNVEISKAVGLGPEYYEGTYSVTEGTCGSAERLTVPQLRAIFNERRADMFPNMSGKPKFGRASMVGIDRYFGI